MLRTATTLLVALIALSAVRSLLSPEADKLLLLAVVLASPALVAGLGWSART